MEQTKVLIAMSGGVDSSVAAFLIGQAGYSRVGAMMRMFDSSLLPDGSSCRSDEDIQDARAVAEKLGIPFHLIPAQDVFARYVIDEFISCYECGLTPNPCICCNRHIKFDFFLDRARELGCDYIATGHYARISFDSQRGRYLLFKAADSSKDQSYVLYMLSQDQLAHTLLPLGELTKERSREIAGEQGLLTAKKSDSQDICFVPDGDYVAFMQRYTGKQYTPGDYLDLEGKVVGTHKGAVCYTLGQRKGLGLALGAPVYVCAKDMEKNTVTVGPNEALFAHTLLADNWNWIPFPTLTAPLRVTARARYNQKEQPATVYPEENGFARVVFDNPQRAMTPGQAVVLYQGDLVVGGGTIREVLRETE